MVVGATNRPQELDEAARRRLVTDLYIPLPELEARRRIITNLLGKKRHELTEDQVEDVTRLTEGYFGLTWPICARRPPWVPSGVLTSPR